MAVSDSQPGHHEAPGDSGPERATPPDPGTSVRDELATMAEVSEKLESLDRESRHRVLVYITDRFGFAPSGAVVPRAEPTWSDRDGGTEPHERASGRSFDTFADLLYAVEPDSADDRALLAAYWIQELCGEKDGFPSFPLNRELKNTGNQISNITNVLSRLNDRSPSLVMQVRSSGKGFGTRKTYKLTEAGIRAAEVLVSSSGP